jgi:thiamine biosynthesis lipoprotein
MKKNRSVILVILFIICSCKGDISDYGRITGFTQGTTYNIVYDGMSSFPADKLRNKVEDILHQIDMSLSVYNDSSVISHLNRNETSVADTFFSQVFRRSQELSEMTGGAFDITVMPLVRAWGFGPDEHKSFEKSKLDSLLKLVGYKKVQMTGNKLVKSDPRITLDVNAIAQGYTVDVLCNSFDAMGLKNYLIEVGGEVRVSGKKGASYWKIGIDRPADSNMVPGATLQAIIELKDKALATSGNYRKFYVEDGIKYSHTIDPKTGYPAKNRLLSATIITTDCATADAIATACMVMGLERSIEFINNNPGLEGYLIYSDDNGNYATWISGSLGKYIKEEPPPLSP